MVKVYRYVIILGHSGMKFLRDLENIVPGFD